MSVIFLLIAAGAFVTGGFLAAFVWAVRSGQFDDTATPAVRVLLDDDRLSTRRPAGRRGGAPPPQPPPGTPVKDFPHA